MKIVIVGAGISGLATYLFIRKYCNEILKDEPLDLVLYESHDPNTKVDLTQLTFGQLSSSTAIIGGGIGLAANGMYILRDLGDDVRDQAMDGGFPCETFVFRSARGWRLQSSPCSDQKGKPGKPPGQEEFCVSMARHNLWSTLAERVDSHNIAYKKVVSVTKGVPEKGQKPSITLEDGDVVEADLVIGADGVRSRVLKGIFGEEKTVEPVYEYVHIKPLRMLATAP
jgi:2-polyprenyl-6-methoxyphenol hydroxylase-like FAD-dependent oxidoreductase